MKRRWENPEYRKKKTEAFLENNPMDKVENREKVSALKFGVKRPEISKRYKGEGNPHYKNGIRTGKRMILEVKQMCEHCGTNKKLEVHHKDENRQNNQLSNLKLLCKSCHSKEHRGIEWSKIMYQSRLKKMEVKNGKTNRVLCEVFQKA